jgi:hypothetical protein
MPIIFWGSKDLEIQYVIAPPLLVLSPTTLRYPINNLSAVVGVVSAAVREMKLPLKKVCHCERSAAIS